jgi:DNA-binding transcriptional LysR family regulator
LQLRLLAFSHWRPEVSWTFVRAGGEERETITFRPQLSMNDFAGLTSALLTRGGVSDLPPICATSLMREGRLVEVMPDWRFPTLDLSLVYLGNRHIPRPVRVFKEFVTQMAPTLFPNLPD